MLTCKAGQVMAAISERLCGQQKGSSSVLSWNVGYVERRNNGDATWATTEVNQSPAEVYAEG